MKKKIFENEKYIIEDRKNWPTVLADNLSIKDKELYIRRKKAVDMYFDNIDISKIAEVTGFHRNTIRELAKRCTLLDEEGNIYGYKALIPYKRINKYIRKDRGESNYSGKFRQLLNKYPSLQEFIENTYLGLYKKSNLEHNIIVSNLHKKFIKKCHDLNIKENEYPFNTKDVARRSLYRYIENLKNTKYNQYLSRLNPNYSHTAKSTGIGIQNNPLIVKPFQQVQFDGHKIDAIICLKIKTIEGDTIKKIMSRIWLLVIIDVATRVILGYHICLNPEYSSYDVLKCIENAIKPKEKLNLTIPNLKYPDNGGFHSIAIEETKWAIWDEFLYDNAKANLAKVVTDALVNDVKCSVNAGPVATPERRGIIERFFRTLETNGFHRLPNTTGSNIYDPKRKDAEKNAIKYEITESDIEEITEILIANYNNTSHGGINGFAPLELMEQRIKERGLIPKIMDKNQIQNLDFCKMKVTRKIRGNREKGHRPHIYYEGVEYRNDILARTYELVGTELTLLVDINDLRCIKAYLPDGSEFGVLSAKNKWCLSPHTLKTRREINKLYREKKLYYTASDDPVEKFNEYTINESLDKKSGVNKLAALQKIQKKYENSQESKLENKADLKINHNKKEQLTNDEFDELEELKKKKRFKTLNFLE
ncbi:hypothetical protein [Intestinibacter sp.]